MTELKGNVLHLKDNIYTKVNEKYFSGFWVIFQAIVLIMVGILILCISEDIMKIITYVISGALIANGLFSVFKNMFRKEKKIAFFNLLQSVFSILVGVYFIYNPTTFINLFPLAFTAYIALDTIIRTITCIIAFENRLDNRINMLIRTILSYIFLVILMIYPLLRAKITVLVGAIYFIILGVTYFLDAIHLLWPEKSKNKIKKRIRVVLPVFIAAFVPIKVLKDINKLFEVKEARKIVIKKEEKLPTIEVLVHVKDLKAERFGHVDIQIDGTIYSYGSYDENKVKFGSSIGDGVLFEVDKQKYIDFCNENEYKNITAFGLQITSEQKQTILNKITEIKKDAYVWKTLNEENDTNEYKDYGSRLYSATKAKFYKFKKGTFKTYFVLYTNCVKLANELIGMSGIDILSINGVITPGTYYEYFNREFKRKNSIVVSKEIHLNRTDKADI